MNQDKYQQMQVLDYQIKQMQKVIESVEIQLAEIHTTIDALRDFDKLKVNDEILFPIANGIFAKGKLIDNKLLKINIGSNVNVDKNINATITMMENQARDIEAYKDEIMTQLRKFTDKMDELQEQVQE
jgi:prefoldin alpha subunit